MLTITDYKVLGQLPNPFKRRDGTLVCSRDEWPEHKEYLKELAVILQFGEVLPSPYYLDVELLSVGKSQVNCKIHTGTAKNRFSFLMKILIPKHNHLDLCTYGNR